MNTCCQKHSNEMQEAPDRLLTVRQTAEMLGLTEKAIRNRIERGWGPPLIRLSKCTIRYSERALREWITARVKSQGDS